MSSIAVPPPSETAGGVLRNRDFVKVWVGESVSMTGAQVTDLALPLVAIMTLQATAFQVALLNVARFAPFLLLTLVAGVFLDRYRRRPVLIGANLGRAILIALVPLTAAVHMLSMPVLYGVAFAAGALTVLFDVAVLSYVPSLVERGHLGDANSKIAASASLAGIAGPGLAGFLVGLLTAPVALVVDAVSYLCSMAALTGVRRREPPPATRQERRPILSSIAEGLHTIFGSPVLRHLATQSATFNLFANVLLAVFLLYAVQALHMAPTQLGLVVGAGSVGTLVGATVANRLRTRWGLGSTLRMATAIACFSPLLLLVPGGADPVSLVLLGVALAAYGAGLAVFNVNALTLRQTICPNHLLGRMNASYRLLLFGMVPLGALIGGALAQVFSLRTAFTVGVVGLVVPLAWLKFSPAFRLREMPDGPSTVTTPRTTPHRNDRSGQPS